MPAQHIEKVKVAAILHDYAKVLPEEEQLLLLSKYLTKDEIEYYKDYLPVIHSILGAYLVKEESVSILNPITEDHQYLRKSLTPTLDVNMIIVFLNEEITQYKRFAAVDEKVVNIFCQ